MRKSLHINLFKSIMIILLFTLNSYSLNLISDTHYSRYNLIYATGRFESGDFNKLKKVYESIPNKRKQTIIVFKSKGGILSEGINIGKFMHKNYIGSAVQQRSTCASSCAIAFLGGRDRYGNKLMILPRSSNLGYHKFYYRQKNKINLKKREQDYNSIRDYFRYVKAPINLMYKMLDTNPDRMYWITHYSNRYLHGLKSRLPVRGRVARGSSRYKSRASLSQSKPTDAIKKYFKSINLAINSKKTYKNNIALNDTEAYALWLETYLDSIKINRIHLKRRNVVEVDIRYYLKNGLRVNSKNIYRLKRDNRSWKIVSKKVFPQDNIRSIVNIKHKLP